MKNIKNVLLKIAKLIKDFLFRPKSKEFFLYVFFCGLATLFWFMLTLNESHKENFSIPIELIGVPSNVMLTNVPDSTILINLTARGTKILDYKLRNLRKKKQPINLRFDSLLLISKKNHIKLPTVSLTRYLHLRYPDATNIDVVSPDTLEYIYAEGGAKRVPLRFNGTIQTSSQIFVVDTILSPDSVDVYAPKSILNTIKEVKTKRLVLKDLSDNYESVLTLSPIKGAKFVPNTTTVNLEVDAITEKTVTIPIVGINFPTYKSLLTFPSEVEVTFQIGTKSFNSVNADNFAIEVSYNDIVNLDGNLPLKLTKYPSIVKHIRLSHKNVDFLIERKAPHL